MLVMDLHRPTLEELIAAALNPAMEYFTTPHTPAHLPHSSLPIHGPPLPIHAPTTQPPAFGTPRSVSHMWCRFPPTTPFTGGAPPSTPLSAVLHINALQVGDRVAIQKTMHQPSSPLGPHVHRGRGSPEPPVYGATRWLGPRHSTPHPGYYSASSIRRPRHDSCPCRRERERGDNADQNNRDTQTREQ